MSNFVSFPNFLCLLLTGGALLLHLSSIGQMTPMFLETPDRLEDRYCRLPQSSRLQDKLHCSSAQQFFLFLGNDCTFESNTKKKAADLGNDTERVEDVDVSEGPEEIVTVEAPENVKVNENKEQEEEDLKYTIIDSFLLCFVICSTIVSVLEWYREKTDIKKQVMGGEGSGGEATTDRRISLADLTVNKHIRREKSQQLETIRQQSSSSGSKPPPLLRRSSFPAQLPESRSRHLPQRQQSTPSTPVGRRLSVDMGEDDGSPERRRVRIIRRH